MAYSNQVINGQTHVWLQDWGWQPAKLGAELEVGDELVFNYGSTAQIISVDKETNATVWVSIRCSNDKVYSKRISKKTYKPVMV